jgi:hypothetical protein
MPELDDAALALLQEALTDGKARRRLVGRLRPRVVGRPHPCRRLRGLGQIGVENGLFPADVKANSTS